MGTLADRHLPQILLMGACAFLVGLFAVPAHAQQAQARTVESALEHFFDANSHNPSVRKLLDAGFSYNRLLVAERLPSEKALFVEVELGEQDTKIRYPLKLESTAVDDGKRWSVAWSPVLEYAAALANDARQGDLASFGVGEQWSEIQRLPAFPIIVEKAAYVTPYGRVSAVPAQASGAHKSAQAPAKLAPPKELVQHAQRWIGLTMEDDPGSANVDLLLGPEASWRHVTEALMAPASLGLFRVYLVGCSKKTIVAVSAVAPVVKHTRGGTVPIVVGMYAHNPGRAFRVRVGPQLLANQQSCAKDMTFCAQSTAQFQQKLSLHIHKALAHRNIKVAYVMLAATGDIAAAEVVPYITALGDALSIPHAKIFIGYIDSP